MDSLQDKINKDWHDEQDKQKLSPGNDGENKVYDFINKVKDMKTQQEIDDKFRNSEKYKLRCLNDNQEKAKGVCLDMIFSKIYKDALPLNNDYKVAHGEDLDADMKSFIDDRCPKGMVYYIHEGIKKGSKPAKKIMDETNKIVNDDYNKKALNLEDYSANDMVFKATDETQKQIDVMSDKLNLDALSSIIKDNVKSSAISEIKRAKEEKEKIKNLESELANDMSVTDDAAIESALELHDINQQKDFVPTLFQGIMIGKVNKLQAMNESGLLEPDNLYNTLSEFGLPESLSESTYEPSIEERAFVEAVKEFTKINVVKALKLESFPLNRVTELANEYAYND